MSTMTPKMREKQHEADLIMLAIARENATGNPTTIRLSDTEREWLGRLAKRYHVKMSEVWRLLLQQAIIDEVMESEVFALRSDRMDK